MGSAAVEALRADRAALLEICGAFSAGDWKAPSACAGWSAQDLVAHMGALYALVVDPSTLPDTAGLPTEQAQEIYVEARRERGPEQVLADYEDISNRALVALEGMDGILAEVPLGDLGTYPLSMLSSAYAFDHYTHIRADLFTPRGSVPGQPPPSDELRLIPTLDWIAAAAVQQNQDVLAGLPGAIGITVTGAGAREITVGTGDIVTTVRCPAHDLVLLATQRAQWDELDVVADGDAAGLAAARRLHIF
jgi:uncharacterized protein (TIGR03083 family)